MTTIIPYPLFAVLILLLAGTVVYFLHTSMYVQKFFAGITSMIIAFMLSQQIVSGNVVKITSLLNSSDVFVTEATEIVIPELAYLFLFVGVTMTLLTTAFATKYIVYLYGEAQKTPQKQTGAEL